jgi:hypothetical protein
MFTFKNIFKKSAATWKQGRKKDRKGQGGSGTLHGVPSLKTSQLEQL